jgi:hypothetical protein
MTTLGPGTQLDFKTLFVSVRPARVAVLVNSADPDWQHTCQRIIEFFCMTWGGAHHIIVPTDGNTISEPFWEILKTFDADYIYQYSKTLFDLKYSAPDKYAQIIEQKLDDWLKDSPGSDRNYYKKYFEDNSKQQWVESFGVSAVLEKEIVSRLAPFHFQDHVVHARIGAGTGAGYPLTAITDLIEYSDHPAEINEYPATVPDIPTLWYTTITGQFRKSDSENLKADGMSITQSDFSEHNAFTYIGNLSARLHKIDEPFAMSMLGVGTYMPARWAFWKEPVTVVIGGTFEDYCLYQCLSRLRHQVAWFLPQWGDFFRTGVEKHKAGGGGAEGRDRFALEFARAVLNASRIEGRDRKIEFLSSSLQQSECQETIKLLYEASFSDSDFLHRAVYRPSISGLLDSPIRVYDTGSAARARIQQFVNGESAGFFLSPRPTKFTSLNAYEHRWISEISIPDHHLPRHPILGTYVLRGGLLTTQDARIGVNGPTYFCPNTIIGNADVDYSLVNPTVKLPSAFEVMNYVATVNDLQGGYSDKGHFLAEAIRKFGGLDNLAAAYRRNERHRLLDKFSDKTAPAKGVYDEGVLIRDRRYLDFVAVEKLLAGDKVISRQLLDDWAAQEILYRGFIFKCSLCRNPDWYAIDEVTNEFRCKRCGRSQRFTSEHWREPEEPSWYYKLDEIVNQGHSHNMRVPVLALSFLGKSKRASFLYSTELEFHDLTTRALVMEIDLCCILDGILVIGEAKKGDELGRNATEDAECATKYRDFAQRMCASEVVFATTQIHWSSRTLDQIKKVFLNSPIKYRILDGQQILS